MSAIDNLNMEEFFAFVDETIKTPKDLENLLERRRQNYQNSWGEYKATLAAQPKQQELFPNLPFQWPPRRG